MDETQALAVTRDVMTVLENAVLQLTPEVVREARRSEEGRTHMDRMEHAMGTIGKLLVLLDLQLNEKEDLEVLKEFRTRQT